MAIKIAFSDMPKGFDTENNIFCRLIRKNFGGVILSDKPDFLIYSVYGTNHYSYDKCTKVFFTGEPVVPNFNECDYGIAFDWIDFGERYYRKPVWLTEYDNFENYVNISDDEILNRRFCNFVYSNGNLGKGADLRKRFVKKLAEYKHVDCAGRVLNNMDSALLDRNDNDWRRGKIDFIKNYKFTIAFENCCVNGYTTEKMIHPVVARSMPIYWGNPLVSRDFNTDAIIICNGYEDDFDSVIDRIIKIDNDDELYLSMIHQNPISEHFNKNEMEEFEEWFIKIIEKGNKPFDKDPIGYAKKMGVNSMSRREKLRYYFLQ